PRWSDSLTGHDPLRVIVNALTRLRFCTADGVMEYATMECVGDAPEGHYPSFEVPSRAKAGAPIVFGHPSAPELIDRPDLLAIDAGCLWGRQLTAVRLADRASMQVQCPQGLAPW